MKRTSLAIILSLFASQLAHAEKLKGYIWDKADGVLLVEGERVQVSATTKIERKNHKGISYGDLRIGWEVEVHGEPREAAFLAKKIKVKRKRHEDIDMEGYIEIRDGDAIHVGGKPVLWIQGQPAPKLRAGMYLDGKGTLYDDGTVQLEEADVRPVGFDEGGVAFMNLASKRTAEQMKALRRVDDDELQSYVSRVGESLVPDWIDREQLDFKFGVIDDPLLNAFSTPDGAVVIHSGLLGALENEAQLATVIGHEIAHVTHQHAYRRAKQSSKVGWGGFGAAIGVAVLGEDSLVGSIVNDASKMALSAAMSGHGRDLEDDADRIGLQYMVRAGYDYMEAPRVWKVLSRYKKDENAIDNFFFSETSTQRARLSNLTREVNAYYRDKVDRSSLVRNAAEYNVATADFEAPARISVPDLNERLLQGNEAYQQGNTTKAMKEWTRGLQKADDEEFPEFQILFNNSLGALYWTLGEYEEALKRCGLALNIATERGDEKGRAIALLHAGNVYWHRGQYEEALTHFTEVHSIAREIDDDELAGNALFNTGNIYRERSEYEKALELFTRVLSEKRAAGDERVEAGALTNMGGLYVDLGQYDDALTHLEEALTLQRRIPDPRGEALTLNNVGTVHWSLGEYEDALVSFEKGLQIQRKLRDVKAEAGSLSNIASTYKIMGDTDEAWEYFGQSLALYRQIGDAKGEAAVIVNMAVFDVDRGEYEKALERMEEALAVSRGIGDVKGEAGGLNNMGTIHLNVGQTKRAEEHFTQSLELTRRIGDKKGASDTLGNLGVVYLRLGEYDRALEGLAEALEIKREMGDARGEGLVLNSIGSVHKEAGQFEQALESYRQALAIVERIGDVKARALTINNIGAVYSDSGNYDRALEEFAKTLTFSETAGDARMEGITRYNIGESLLASDRAEEAERNLVEAAALLENIRDDLGSAQHRSGFQSSYSQTYAVLAASRLTMGETGAAFEAIERGRAKSLIELLAARTAPGRVQGKSAKLVALERQLAQLREKRTELAAQPLGEKTRSGRDTISRNISEIEAKRAALIDEIHQENPELRSFISVDSPTLQEVQSFLPPEVTLVEYFHPGELKIAGETKDELWIFVVQQNGFSVVNSEIAKSSLQEKLTSHAELLGRPDSDPAVIRALGEDLYKWLVKPIEEQLDTPT